MTPLHDDVSWLPMSETSHDTVEKFLFSMDTRSATLCKDRCSVRAKTESTAGEPQRLYTETIIREMISTNSCGGNKHPFHVLTGSSSRLLVSHLRQWNISQFGGLPQR